MLTSYCTERTIFLTYIYHYNTLRSYQLRQVITLTMTLSRDGHLQLQGVANLEGRPAVEDMVISGKNITQIVLIQHNTFTVTP